MVILGTNNNDNLVGTSGNDTIQGLNGNDTLSGLGGNDQLSGGAGSDTLSGGAGNDQFVFEYFDSSVVAKVQDIVTDFQKGQDKIDLRTLGISDFDNLLLLISNDIDGNAIISVRYRVVDGDYYYRLKLNGISSSQLQASDFIFNSAVVDNTITGTAYNDDLFAGLGNDTLQGGDGNDRLFGEQGNDRLLGGFGKDTLYGGAGNDEFVFEYFDNSILAKEQDIVIDFQKGQDKIDLRTLGISDFNNLLLLISDDVDGNAIISVRYRVVDGDYYHRLKLNGISSSQLQASDFIFNSAVVDNNITGTAYNDDLFGGLGNDTLSGGDGNDRLFGEQGNDRLLGGAGKDTLYGGAGNDEFVFEYFDNSIAAKEQDIVIDFQKGQDKIDIRTLGISDFNNLLLLTSNDVDGNAIISVRYRVLDGDYYYRLKLNGISVSQLQASDFIFNSAVVDNNITGTAYNDDLFAGLGNDTLSGAGGNDRLFGEQGNDRLLGDAGNDTLYGGAGNDTYSFLANTALGTDTIIETTTGGADTINFSGTTTAVNVNLGLTTSQTVNSNLNLILFANNVIENTTGGTGNDSLTGNTLNNTLIGGGGNDRLQGLAGDDTYSFVANTALGTDTIIETTTGGTDTINFSGTTVAVNLNLGVTTSQTVNSNLNLILSTNNVIENATGGTGNDTLTGNTLNNTLIGGSGNDSLQGLVGNDTYSFVANSALGTDTITETTTGGTDTINFSDTTVAVNLNLGVTTSQTVNSNLKLILSANNVIENATGGTGNDSLTGNTLNNTLIGGDGNDQLQGLVGNDTLVGGNGNDTLAGGVGNDKYLFQSNSVFNTSLGIDTITDFEVGQDQIVLSKTTFNAITNTVGQALTDFAVVSGNQFVNGSNARIVFSQSSGSLFYNQDGNVLGTGTVFEFARLGNPNITLSSSNFSLIA
ncbi:MULTISPECIES: M10 family metallopeptidase C-terminal domain-containing protein [unclassified Nostoc]|uniref:M10 family metallopeptidase C-terminal domain-containing protein n=1 Tax=unclassified Nostoc TaxID=2593658 RepID=UPI00391ACA8B